LLSIIKRLDVAMPSEVSTAGADQDLKSANEELERALAEAHRREAATTEVLRVIGRSPTELQPVLDALVKSAIRFCRADDVIIMSLDGNRLVTVAHHGSLPGNLGLVVPAVHGTISGRCVLERRAVHVADLLAETEEFPEGSSIARTYNYHRTTLGVPLLRGNAAIGCLVLRRSVVRPFTDDEIALVTTFADQAVIAIENTRLFEAEQARTKELAELLEQQTATSEVLNVISRSPTDVQPVFDAIAKSAAQLCDAEFCNVFRFDGELVDFAASYGTSMEVQDEIRRRCPVQPSRGFAAARAILSNAIENIPDIYADPEYAQGDIARAGALRSAVAVPMRKEGRPVGAIAVVRSYPGHFPERQIELLKTFADQAVIAIENTRLFEAEQASKRELQARTRELQESLEYQTATSEVLSVISRSPNDLQPVLDAIVATAHRLCQAEYTLFSKREDDGLYHIKASVSADPGFVEWVRAHPIATGEGSMVGLVAAGKETTHFPDCLAEPRFTDLERQQQSKARTMLGVPLLRENEVIGVIFLARTVVQPFTDRQIALVTTFADQAVIAIENTRLFEAEQASKRELTEALEQQTATADVLKVISRSALDLQRVLDALVESAARLCDAYDAVIYQVFGDGLRLVAHRGQIPLGGPVGQYTIPLGRGRIPGRAVIERRTIQVADALVEADEYPESRKRALEHGWRTALCVPLLHAGEAIGVINIRRAEVRPFTERQVELVNTFADQAVIAIENTRLFEEVQARTRELAKTVEDLEIASQHKNQFVANMSHELRTPLAAILGYAELIQEGFYELQGPKSLDALSRIRSNGKHLLGLINTVLDIAKIESGQFTLNMTEYAIESVVETVRAATESLAQNKGLTLKTEVAKPLPIGLGDEQRLTQVLLNLVGNAIKFTDTGEVRVTATALNGHFNVSVTDTGPGIPTEHQTRIFEQFHQVDSSNTKAKGGTGLGLAIAREIVEMHGGRIWVESTLGKGSTFQMKLPTRAEFRKRAL
jgi:signal transduction histidine kinase